MPSSVSRLVLILFVGHLSLIGCDDYYYDDDDDDDVGSDDDDVGSDDDDDNPDNGDFVVVWGDDSGYEPYSLWLQENSGVQEIADTLNNTFRLPGSDLPFIHEICSNNPLLTDPRNAFFYSLTNSITICYEFIERVDSIFVDGFWGTDFEPQTGQAVIETYWFVLFHELGHGLVWNYNLPVTGSQEDAVDEFSSLLLIQSGQADAVVGAAFYWLLSNPEGSPTPSVLADTHGLNMQRMYNMLCWVYGSNPSAYGHLLEWFPDLGPRAANCEAEYEQKVYAWGTLLQPWEQ